MQLLRKAEENGWEAECARNGHPVDPSSFKDKEAEEKHTGAGSAADLKDQKEGTGKDAVGSSTAADTEDRKAASVRDIPKSATSVDRK